jgi:maltose/moltooligosaccharide transporter
LSAAQPKPDRSFWQIWNMCFGFLGLQFGFALQNANVSRIFQSLGASLDQIPILWIAAPLTGLIVQPVIGYFSDRTWTRLGRRRPYFFSGAVLASLALFAMPRSAVLWMAAGLLWMLDASINISMEPFRAFVGDQLAPPQRPRGYAMQGFFISVGSVVASLLPTLLTWAGVSNAASAAEGRLIPDALRLSFEIGAVVLLVSVLWTVFSTREYPPDELRAFSDARPAGAAAAPAGPSPGSGGAWLWMAAGAGSIAGVRGFALDQPLYILGAGMLFWGLAQWLHGRRFGGGFFGAVMDDVGRMPHAMRRLIPVQFFSWLALFSMWIYTTPAVTQVHFGATDAQSAAFNTGANWVGTLFAAYNGFAALASILIPWMVRLWGLRFSHLVNLLLGGLALLSFLVIRDPQWLLASMLGVGFAWASILSLPYALLSDCVPAEKMGVYMGIFNFFIVIPQLVAASVLGFLLKGLFGGAPIYALAIGGASFLVAGALALRVPQAPGGGLPAA